MLHEIVTDEMIERWGKEKDLSDMAKDKDNPYRSILHNPTLEPIKPIFMDYHRLSWIIMDCHGLYKKLKVQKGG